MEIIDVNDPKYSQDLKSIEQNRHRLFAVVSPEISLSADRILQDIDNYQRKRVIVICNTVAKAQGLYLDLKQHQNNNIKIILLHSRFLPEHRATKETELEKIFKEKWQDDGICYVLIATQVIEVGINITSQVMHTEICPINSLLQRAGRCARFANERGQVYIYWSVKYNPIYKAFSEFDNDPELGEFEESDNPKLQRFLPYSKKLCEWTWKKLEEHTNSDKIDVNVGFETEINWVNQVHEQEDKQNFNRRQNNRKQFNKNYQKAIFQGDTSARTELIRNINSRSVFIWDGSAISFDETKELEFEPQKRVSFSLPVSVLCSVYKEISQHNHDVFKEIKVPKNKAETYTYPICTPITSIAQLINSLRIVINSKYVDYDEDIGLVLNVKSKGEFKSPIKKLKNIKSEYTYHMDTYVEHLQCMWTCWQSKPFETERIINGNVEKITFGTVREEILAAGGKFIQNKIFLNAKQEEAEALFEILVFLAIFTHDLGKLQVKWQAVMRGWQTIAYETFKNLKFRDPGSELLAHTDFDPENEAVKQKYDEYTKKHKRPNHAVEGAFLAEDILQQSLEPLLAGYFDADDEQIDYFYRIIEMAAGRHHSAWAEGWEFDDIAKLKKLELEPTAKEIVAESWRKLVNFLPKTLPFPPDSISLFDVSYETEELKLKYFFSDNSLEYYQLYALVVRALRLCDMRSVQLR
ncbi:CRISPR-associated helicase Cas3' [Gloeothece citriformis]|uniref:CRISPR-associated helicase Cas3' n=1 Tax=Gloeothece citriformis TaxID=2546356 RepID=UPI000173DAAF|nr:CRISPR-associated helicase Cas3' [Gloeothece citriformis]